MQGVTLPDINQLGKLQHLVLVQKQPPNLRLQALAALQLLALEKCVHLKELPGLDALL